MEKSRMTTLGKEIRTDSPVRAPLKTTFRPTHEAIAKRAYELFEDSGRPPGRDVEFWLKAEHELITLR